jgi:hypothetical protein
MPAQSQVNKYLATGVPGARASLNPCVYTPNTPLAEGDVEAGRFVWPGTSPDVFTVRNSGGGHPLGFACRVIAYPNHDPLDSGTLTIRDGEAVTVAVRGDFYAVSETNAAVGDRVFANPADGGIMTGNAAPSNYVVDTGWCVKTAGASGEPIIISNWS